MGLIEFGTIYSNTSLSRSIKISNNSPEKTTFNASILKDQEGELMGEDGDILAMESLAHQNPKWNKERKGLSKYDAFEISPATGFLNPGQSTVIDVTFKPTLPSKDQNSEADKNFDNFHNQVNFVEKRDYVIFMTIHTGNWSEDIGDTIKAIAKPCEVALVGSVTNPAIGFSPTNKVEFEPIMIGEKAEKIITIHNDASIPIDINLSKIPHFTVTPNNFRIASESSQNLSIIFNPKTE